MAGPRILEDHGSYLKVEKADGTPFIVTKSAYEANFGALPAVQEAESTAAPEPTPASAPPPVSPDIAGSPAAQAQQEPQAQQDTQPVPISAPVSVPPPIDDSIAGSPGYQDQKPPQAPQAPQVAPGAGASPAAPTEEPPPVSGDTVTVQDTNRSIREVARDKQAAQDKITNLDAADADKLAEILDQHHRELTRRDKARQAVREQELAEGRAELNKLKSMYDSYASAEIDPDHIWADKGTGSKILAGISVALSGLGMALKGKGGENPALNIIESAIDRDLKIQFEKIERMGKAAENQKGLVAEYWKHADRKENAFTMAKATVLEHTARRFELVGAKSKSARVKANAEVLAAKTREKVARELEKVRVQVVDDRQQNYQNRTARINADNNTREQDRRDKQFAIDQENARKKAARVTDDSNWVNGVGGGKLDKNRVLIDDPKTREEIRSIVVATQGKRNALKRLEQIVSAEGREFSWSEASQEALGEAYSAATTILHDAKGTSSTADAIAYLGGLGIKVDKDGNIASPTEWGSLVSPDTRVANYRAARERAARQANDKLKTYGDGSLHYVDYNDLPDNKEPPRDEVGSAIDDLHDRRGAKVVGARVEQFNNAINGVYGKVNEAVGDPNADLDAIISKYQLQLLALRKHTDNEHEKLLIDEAYSELQRRKEDRFYAYDQAKKARDAKKAEEADKERERRKRRNTPGYKSTLHR